MPDTVLYDGDSGPAQAIVALTLSANTIPTTKAILCGTAGTLTGVDERGNAFTSIPLQQGYNPIRITKASAGTAANLWALY